MTLPDTRPLVPAEAVRHEVRTVDHEDVIDMTLWAAVEGVTEPDTAEWRAAWDAGRPTAAMIDEAR